MSDTAGKVDIYRERIFPVLFMFLVTVVFISIVSGIYLATKERVVRNEQLFMKTAVLFAAGIDLPEEPVQQEALFEERIEEVTDDAGNIRYFAIDGGNSGYIIPVTGAGLWGKIEAVIGFSPDLERLSGIDFVSQNETPGLGARITEDWFKRQFEGKTGPFTRAPEGTESDEPTVFDAITGATLTSRAVELMVNSTIEKAPGIIAGE